jgi:hypothetical protein
MARPFFKQRRMGASFAALERQLDVLGAHHGRRSGTPLAFLKN